MAKISDPLWASDSFSEPHKEYRAEIRRYQQELVSNGGYWNATLKLTLPWFDGEESFQKDLGRFVELYDSEGKFFEGFINVIILTLGTLTATRGPLLAIANRIQVLYSTIDTSTAEPTLGIRTATAEVNDTFSQDRYGIHQKIFSVGGATATAAEQIRDGNLEELQTPETSQLLTIGSAQGKIEVTLEIVGLSQIMKNYIIADATTGEGNASDKVETVLGDDPNSIISTNYSNIDENTTQVALYEDEYRTGWQVIKGIVAHGDTSFNRWLFGIYGNQLAHFNQIPIPTNVRYTHNIADRKQAVFSNEIEVNPWRVLPGYWLKIGDFLVGTHTDLNPTSESDLRKDPRIMFIESARFTTPNILTVSGTKVGRTSQLLAQLGLGGVG